jgi:PTH1 family peptidyl-tRNA hydrolase
MTDQSSASASLPTRDRTSSKVLVGLGNPGKEYENTRHNFGFMVIDELARRLGLSFEQEVCRSLVASSNRAIDLVKPLTYMNRSGYALRCLVERWSYDVSNILVIYDEIALPLGKLRLRTKGSPGGHRGMESVIENLRTAEVARLRVGVAPVDQPDLDQPDFDLAEFVLSDFGDNEMDTVKKEIDRAADACISWLDNGATQTMNQFNG